MIDGPVDETARDATAGDSRAREQATRDLQTQLIHFKRTLHMIRTGSALHRSVSPAGVPVLGVLRRCGPLRTTMIATEVCLDPSTVSRQVDSLVRSGHVEKVPDPADGRALLVQLTERGRGELAGHLKAITSTLGGLLDQWPVEDVATMATLLGRLNDEVYTSFAPATAGQPAQPGPPTPPGRPAQPGQDAEPRRAP